MTRPATGSHAAERSASWPRFVAGAGGVVLLALGLWAMVSPQSFFDTTATFEPYNRHFLQDVGAFQIGLGAVLLLALTGRDALAVALVGVGIGSLAHTVSHVLGVDLGGTPAVDIPVLSILTVLLVVAGWTRWNQQVRRD